MSDPKPLKLRLYLVADGGVILRCLPMFSYGTVPEELYLGLANSAHSLAWQVYDLLKRYGLDVDATYIAGSPPRDPLVRSVAWRVGSTARNVFRFLRRPFYWLRFYRRRRFRCSNCGMRVHFADQEAPLDFSSEIEMDHTGGTE